MALALLRGTWRESSKKEHALTYSASSRTSDSEPELTDALTEGDEQATEQLRIQLLQIMAKIRGALQKWHAAHARHRGAATDLFRGQGRALALLAERGEMAQRDMCDALGIRPQSLGETLAKLERAGHIERKLIDSDHRALVVRITDSGRTVIANSKPNSLFTSFTSDELRQFISYLERALTDIEEQSASMGERLS